jgi:hypothetical protein
MPHDLPMFMFRFMIALGKAKGWGTFLRGDVGLWLPPILGPLFWECLHPRALSYSQDNMNLGSCVVERR